MSEQEQQQQQVERAQAQPQQKEEDEDQQQQQQQGGSIDTNFNQVLPPGQHDIVKDVAMNPLGKRKKMLSEEIGEQNLQNVGKKDGKEDNDAGSLRIRIQLDLDVEVHLSARVKGDITIGLL
ncbi:hypothetical protein IAT40_001116 [Kwoniella sp. CBS 6097]